MTVIKSKANSNFTIIPNETLQDKLLDFDSRGLLNYMLSLPPNWEFKIDNLIQESPNAGRDKIKRMVKELEQSGYIIRKSKRTEDGKFKGVCWIISPVRDYSKKINEVKKPRTRCNPLTDHPSDIKKNINKNSSSNSTREDFFENLDKEKTKEEKDNFFNSVIEEIQLKLKQNCEKVTNNVKWYINMKVEEFITRYPHSRSKADCCMYVVKAVNSMKQK